MGKQMESYSVTKKASTTDTGTTMAEFQKHDAEWKKKNSHTEEYVL